MKRQVENTESTTSTTIQAIGWSCCCICAGDGGLRSTSDDIESLAAQFVQYYKNGVLDFDPAKFTTQFVVGEDGSSNRFGGNSIPN